MSPELDAKWKHCMAIFAYNLDENKFKTWFAPIRFEGLEENSNTIILRVPSKYFAEYIDEHYIKLLSGALRHTFGNVNLTYKFDQHDNNENSGVRIGQQKISKNTPANEGLSLPDSIEKKIRPLPEFITNLNPDLSFDNFVEGDSNKFALSVGRSIAEKPEQRTFNPLFIYGHSGVGKTHLANAIGLKSKEIRPEMRVLYVTAHLFQTQYVDAQIRENRFNDFMRFYQTIDLLIVDDVQEFQGMKQTLNVFFNIFNHLRMNGKQIILTCDRSPSDLRDMEERMLTRFKWGLQCEIQQPGEALRYKILKDKIKRDGLTIDEDVIRYIAQSVSDNVRELEGIVNSLMAHSVCLGREIDLVLAKQIVKKAVRVEREPITIDRIIGKVCDVFGVSSEEVQSSSRKAIIAKARQTVMFLAARMTDMSSIRIGALMGRRSHATVLHSIKQIDSLMLKDEEFREKIDNIIGALQNRVIE